MDLARFLTASLAVSFISGCSPQPSAPPPDTRPTPAAKTVFDPLTQQLGKARGVQQTVDANADATRRAVDAEERGESSP